MSLPPQFLQAISNTLANQTPPTTDPGMSAPDPTLLLSKQYGPVSSGPVWSTAMPQASGQYVMAPPQQTFPGTQIPMQNQGMLAPPTPQQDYSSNFLAPQTNNQFGVGSVGGAQLPPPGGLLDQTPSATKPDTVDDDPYGLHSLHSNWMQLEQGVNQAGANLAGAASNVPQAISAAQLIGGKNTKADLTKLIPLALSLLFGKKGQEFAGGYIPGLLQGKQNAATLQNQNAMAQYQGKVGGLQTLYQGAQQQAQVAGQQYGYAQQQAKFDAMYGSQSSKMQKVYADREKALMSELKSGDPQIAATAAQGLVDLGRQSGAFVDQNGQFHPGLYGAAVSPEDVAKYAAGTTYTQLQDAKIGRTNALTAKDVEKTRGEKIANDFSIRTEGIRFTAAQLKNAATQASISKMNDDAKAALGRMRIADDRAKHMNALDDAHKDLFVATSAIVGDKARADIAKTYEEISHWQTGDQLAYTKDQRATVGKSIGSSISSLNTEMRLLGTRIATIKKDPYFTKEEQDVENDPKAPTPLHDAVNDSEKQLDILSTQSKALRDTGEQFRAESGYGTDGKPVPEEEQRRRKVLGRTSVVSGEQRTTWAGWLSDFIKAHPGDKKAIDDAQQQYNGWLNGTIPPPK